MISRSDRRRFIWLGLLAAVILVCGLLWANRRRLLEKLAENAVPGALAKILKDIDAQKWEKGSSPEIVVNDPRLPIGHRRMFAVSVSDEDIENGGFSQYYLNGLGCLTVPAIEAYEKAGQSEMVAVLKKALKISLAGGPISADDAKHKEFLAEFRDKVVKTHFQIPPGFLDAVEVQGKNLDDLNDEYYALVSKLPGAKKYSIDEISGFVNWYYEKFPEEFVLPK